NFARDIGSAQISDLGQHRLHGHTVNLPTRAVTGHNWTGDEADFKVARAQYGAIHFHDDDLEDAGREVDFEWTPPDDWPSGLYAAHLSAGDDASPDAATDYLPFIVTPKTPRAPIAFLGPTLTCQVCANQRFIDPIRASLGLRESGDTTPQDQYMQDHRLLSCYDLHSDDTGVCYASRLRPMLNIRPGYRMPSRSLAATWPRWLNADLHLLDWLDTKDFDYDVITDDQLHHQGSELLSSYRVILTGTHPEYWTAPMLEGMESYQADGGRLMYLPP
ncbi:MAG: N,N-dimethylformamidase, partial [candidate division Zixibacteria bacterium]|nr:N,N-dimethylformamidase [candidate division Zixibacteria bacterium]